MAVGMTARVLIEEENVVSLRSAVVEDDGRTVALFLSPQNQNSPPPKRSGYTPVDVVWLYRWKKAGLWQLLFGTGSLAEDLYGSIRVSGPGHILARSKGLVGRLLLRAALLSVNQDVRAMSFPTPPNFKLLWAESGHSVAVLLNGEPWAFICEGQKRGYSKGIVRPSLGNPWNQALFENVFKGASLSKNE
jgi:hypothetical protein